MIGAVVGVQPFGGRGLSGTGPKAGGPLYVERMKKTPTGDANLPTEQDVLPRVLVSATGERNLYMREPLGCVVAVYAASDALDHCLATIDAALATGNYLQLYAPEQWRPSLEHRLGVWRDQVIARGGASIAVTGDWWAQGLQDGSAVVVAPGSCLLPSILSRLAQRRGAVPRLICEHINGRYWINFIVEKVVTTDTTAAGGNASLMTLQSYQTC